MRIEMGFGTGKQIAEIPEKNILQILYANEVKPELTGEDEVRRSLNNPIGSTRLRDIVKPGEKIAIISSDITRPMPTYTVMPAVLEELSSAGINLNDVTLVFALGSHRQHTEEEKIQLAGEAVYNTIKCADSNPDDYIHLGTTQWGTPVDITRIVAEADRRICLGNIEYHYFAGYSGGGKAIMPGVSTPAAIQANHSRMVNPKACAGNITDNPIREDIEEAAELCGVDFIINVILDDNKQIIRAVSGDKIKAHRAGCRFLDSLYQVNIPHRADIVIVSQGGAPKDLNLYQTQKALDNAKHAVKDGGTVILLGSCKEGMGEKTFEEWMLWANEPKDLTDRIQKEFKLGGHKAAAIAMVMEKADVYLISDLENDFVKSLFFKPYDDMQSAVNDAIKKHGEDAEVIVMPYGGSTLPVCSTLL